MSQVEAHVGAASLRTVEECHAVLDSRKTSTLPMGMHMEQGLTVARLLDIILTPDSFP